VGRERSEMEIEKLKLKLQIYGYTIKEETITKIRTVTLIEK
jgi:N-acetyl-anhydromuramyl-L-alanine amidase AmpD